MSVKIILKNLLALCQIFYLYSAAEGSQCTFVQQNLVFAHQQRPGFLQYHEK